MTRAVCGGVPRKALLRWLARGSMKSGRQRRAEIQVHRTGKRAAAEAEDARVQAKRAAKAQAARLKGRVLGESRKFGANEQLRHTGVCGARFLRRHAVLLQGPRQAATVDRHPAKVVVRVGQGRCLDHRDSLSSLPASRARKEGGGSQGVPGRPGEEVTARNLMSPSGGAPPLRVAVKVCAQ